MAGNSLASPSDLCTRLGTEVPETGSADYRQMQTLLDDASSEVLAVIGQPIAKDTGTVDLFADGFKACRSYVDLPAAPVHSVDSVEVGGHFLDPTDYLVKYRTLWLPRVHADDKIAVTFTYGYDPVPEEVVKWTCVLAAAIRAASSESDSLGITAGVSQHTQSIDDYSETWANYGGATDPVGLSLPSSVATRLRATYGTGGISVVSFR